MGRSLKYPVAAGRLAAELNLSIIGDPSSLVTRVDTADDSDLGSLCFAKNKVWASKVRATTVLIADQESASEHIGTSLVSSEPRLDFARTLALLERWSGFVWCDSPPWVHPTATVGKNVFLGNGVRIGAESIIHHNVVIGAEVILGDRCIVKSGAVIGEEGFGFERDSCGKAVRLHHIGSVVIGNDVEVGSLTTVCRGTLRNTRLRDGCKVDDHVHIAHNVDVGDDAFIIACAEISGGVSVGPRAWIAPNACVINQVTIGADAVIGLGAVVVKSVPDSALVVGNPAKSLIK